MHKVFQAFCLPCCDAWVDKIRFGNQESGSTSSFQIKNQDIFFIFVRNSSRLDHAGQMKFLIEGNLMVFWGTGIWHLKARVCSASLSACNLEDESKRSSWTCFPRPPSKEPPHWPLFILYQLFINRLPSTEGTRYSPPETDTWKWGHGLRSESKPMAIATMHPLTFLSLSSCPDARGPTRSWAWLLWVPTHALFSFTYMPGRYIFLG